MNYYNENGPGAADWLESLVDRQMIPAGVVDRRSIEDVLPDELNKYTQCHFFAGIGGWSRALELASFPSTREVWTGSCPCQPFSVAGKGAGVADERHLWPAFHWLISQCRPELVFGEQVAGKAGESWFDIVQHDLAGEGYTSGMSVLAACSVGAPHIRKRLYWVANAEHDGGRADKQEREAQGGVVDGWANPDWIECRDGKARPFKPGVLPLADGLPGRVGLIKGYGNAIVPQCGAAFVNAASSAILLRHPRLRGTGVYGGPDP